MGVESKSIDLFCGAGGLSLGPERAGFHSVLGLDTNRDAMETYRRRFPNAKTEEQSIVDFDFRQWHGVDLVAGGPPCQPFSNGDKRLAAQDARDMLPEFARAVNGVIPRAFIMDERRWPACAAQPRIHDRDHGFVQLKIHNPFPSGGQRCRLRCGAATHSRPAHRPAQRSGRFP